MSSLLPLIINFPSSYACRIVYRKRDVTFSLSARRTGFLSCSSSIIMSERAVEIFESIFLRKSSGKGESVGVCPRFHNVLRCVFPFQPFACFSVYFGCKAGNLFGNRTSCTRDGIIIIPTENTNGVWSMKKKYQR